MKPLSTFLLLAALAVGVCSCAHVQPGADPFIVGIERTETTAKATFEAVLTIDHSDRGFWRTNAPAFHRWCEDWRTPTPYQVTNTVPRWAALVLSLDDLKQEYKLATTSSNAVWTVLQTVNATLAQASAWYQIVSLEKAK